MELSPFVCVDSDIRFKSEEKNENMQFYTSPLDFLTSSHLLGDFLSWLSLKDFFVLSLLNKEIRQRNKTSHQLHRWVSVRLRSLFSEEGWTKFISFWNGEEKSRLFLSGISGVWALLSIEHSAGQPNWNPED